jgi:uncharacterized membrane protein
VTTGVYSRTMSRPRKAAPTGLALAFSASGIVHVLRPQLFESIMPRSIPARHHRALIYVSGVAELICAIGLFRRKPWAGAASTAVLVGVFPANVQMALDAGSGRNPGAPDNAALAWGRLPLQAVMIWAARQARVPSEDEAAHSTA